MKIKLLTSLGTRDAGVLGLNHHDCGCGELLEVTDEVGQQILLRGWCEVVEETKPPTKPKAKAKPKAKPKPDETS
ncbi:MAG: hypothetical protein HKN35_15770 [Woeseia sp.]|nr:hypothetical protein [Woeseia sp.]